jgi:predicted transcriptional regulator
VNVLGYTFEYKPGHEGLRKVLGDLEADIMETLWERRGGTAAEVHAALAERRDVAYTTVLTVLNRLADKRLVHVRKGRRPHFFAPVASRGQFLRFVVGRVVDSLLQDFSEPFFAHLDSVLQVPHARRSAPAPKAVRLSQPKRRGAAAGRVGTANAPAS